MNGAAAITIDRQLGAYRRRASGLGYAAGAAWGAVTLAAVLILGMWADLVVEWPGWLRAGCDAAAFVAGLVVLSRVVRGWRRLGREAVAAERMDGVAGASGQIRSGIDLFLHRERVGSAELTTGMTDIAIEQAARLIERVRLEAVLPSKPLRFPGIVLAVIALFVLLVAVVAPRLAATQAARFFDPFGDHPPYSRVVLRVEPGDASVIYGGALDVRATPDGGVAERLDLVLRGAAGEESLPMFQEPSGAWRATVVNVVSPAEYFVRGGGSRSKRFSVKVVTVPKIGQVRLRVTPPAYTNRPVYEGPVPQGGVAALPGTTVEIILKSNRPLSGERSRSPPMPPRPRPALPPLPPSRCTRSPPEASKRAGV